MEVLIWLENTILRLAFANTVFHKKERLQIFYAVYTKSALDILLYPESTISPPWLGQEKNFKV